MTINDDLAQILARADRPGDFVAAGVVTTPLPLVQVAGVGPLSFPLPDAQAEQLIAVAERAPYGRSEATLVDTDVRRTWQIDASSVSVAGAIWPGTLDRIVTEATTHLGVEGVVRAELYKLLLYDAGSFFVEHRDSEKADGMFATLVIVLPSLFSGGELVVRHREQKVTSALQNADLSQVAFAAFYADCRHEVRPVVAGKRLALVYNLLRTSDAQPLAAPDLGGVTTEATALLARWHSSPGWPTKLVYPLAHEYTLAGLTFARLKGEDDAAARTLTAAAAQADCALYLATLAIEESGSAEQVYTRRRSRWESAGDAFEISEVYERSETLTDWRPAAGEAALPINRLPYEAGEVSPLDALEGVEPDEVHFSEATGNEGASFEQSYRRGALVLWPRTRHLQVIAQAGTAAGLAHLATLVAGWEQASGDARAPALADAHALAGLLIDRWTGGAARAATLLRTATRVGDRASVVRLVGDVLSRPGGLEVEQLDVVAAAVRALDDEAARACVTKLVNAQLAAAPDACAGLLARLGDGPPAVAHAAARAAVAQLAAVGHPAPGAARWHHVPKPTAAFVADLLTALLHVADEDLIDRAVHHALATPAGFPVDGVLLEAACQLAERFPPEALARPAIQGLLARCLGHIGERSGPLAPPPDWARPFAARCRCQHCQALARFMADRARETWVYPVAEAHRGHLTSELSGCDAKAKTVKRGNPYQLVVTKNDASYQRLLAQRQADIAAFEQLAPLLAT